MPIHLDDLLGTPPQRTQPHPSTTLDDVLDYVGAAGKGLLHTVGIPTSVPKTPGELLDATSVFVPNIYGQLHQGYEMVQHEIAAVRGVRDAPTVPRKIQAGVTGVPVIGDPLAAVAEPGIEYGEGTAPTHQANLGAVESGVNLAGLLIAPKVIKAAGKRFGTETVPPESPGLTPDKAVEARSEVFTPPAEGVHLDDLLNAPSDELTDEEMAARMPGIEARKNRYSPEAAIERENLPVEEFVKQRFPKATINTEAGPEWAAQVISRAPEGRPGLSIEDAPADLKKEGIDLQIVYRDPQGKPVAVASVVQGEGEAWVRDVATDKSQGLLGAKAASAVAQEIERMGIRDHVSEISPDAARVVQRAEARNARRNLADIQPSENVPTVQPRTSGMDIRTPQGPTDADFKVALIDDSGRVRTSPDSLDEHARFRESLVDRGHIADEEAHMKNSGELAGWTYKKQFISIDDVQAADGNLIEAFNRKYPTAKAISAPEETGTVHLDDLLEEPPKGGGYAVPKYPWAQNIKIPSREAPPSSPPSEPVQPSAPNEINSTWLDDFPEAEPEPLQPETPMPADLGGDEPDNNAIPTANNGLPDQLTSEPKPTSPEEVRNMIGADADAELANAKATRKTFFEKGGAMLRKSSQIFNALLVPGDDVLLKSGPAGQDAVRTTRPIELVRAQAVGKADALYHDMTAGMTSAEKGGMGLLLDGQLDTNSPNVTPRMRAAEVEARKFFDDYLARAQSAGTGVEAKQGFFPHFREAPIHDVEKPLPEFQKFGMESPSFHYHQVDDRPGYSLDLGYVMRRYAYNAESELQAIQAFGAADADTISNKIGEWGDAIAKQGGDGVLAKKILLEKFNMESPELPSMRKASRDVAATIGAMNTLTTPIRHIGKYVNSLSQIGFRGAGKGLAKIAEAIVSPEARQEIRASGVSLRNSMDLVIPNTSENAFYRITRALPWIKATKALDAGGRVMTYFGADPWIDETVRVASGDKTYLGSLTKGMRQRAVEDAFNRAHNIFGISEQSIESGDLTPAERDYARLAASDVTEFNPERGQLPYAATVGAAGRLFYNLRKFATSQANFMYNNVVKPASYGNIKPMARFLAGSALAGAVAEPLLHMVNRQPDAVLNYFGVPLRPEGNQTWEDWRKNAMAVGALHNLGLIYLMMEGRDVLQAVPMASAGLLGRGLHGAVSDFVNAGRVSIGHPNEKDKIQEDLPQWWDEAQTNLKDLDGKNVKDIARSTQMTWLLRKWYREARGLQDQ